MNHQKNKTNKLTRAMSKANDIRNVQSSLKSSLSKMSFKMIIYTRRSVFPTYFCTNVILKFLSLSRIFVFIIVTVSSPLFAQNFWPFNQRRLHIDLCVFWLQRLSLISSLLTFRLFVKLPQVSLSWIGHRCSDNAQGKKIQL